MTELKPCPFCGGEAKISDYLESTPTAIYLRGKVSCQNCKAQIIGEPVDYSRDIPIGDDGKRLHKTRAIEAWNRRVTDERDCDSSDCIRCTYFT